MRAWLEAPFVRPRGFINGRRAGNGVGVRHMNWTITKLVHARASTRFVWRLGILRSTTSPDIRLPDYRLLNCGSGSSFPGSGLRSSAFAFGLMGPVTLRAR